MRTAVISDIHGNLEALQRVLRDIERREADEIVCLGDIIGYGPNPLECLDLVRQSCAFALMGNHDFAVLYEPTSFNASAEGASYWTRKQFELEPSPGLRRQRWEYLGSLPMRKRHRDSVWVHASPRRPINDYIFPDDVITAPTKMQQVFDRVDRRCFLGHTHVAGMFTDEPDFYPPADLGGKYKWRDEEKTLINPGSVGQPRDRDPRASYCIFDDHAVEFFRVDYDVEKTIEKIQAQDDLNDFLGQRLLEGR